MIKRTSLLDRNIHKRDAWICVIVTEGESTEPQYFEGLQATGIINCSRVKVEVVPASPEKHDSAPQHVCSRADEFASRFKQMPEDQVWLVLDVDRWGNKNLAAALNHAKAKNYRMAVSNPCFEIWLLLHVTAEVDGLQRRDCEPRLREILGSYNKSNLDLSHYTAPTIRLAMERARALEPAPSGWPLRQGSHVYLLMAELLPPS